MSKKRILGSAIIVVCLFALAAVLFPMVARAPTSPNGMLLGNNGKPLKNEEITVRANGNVHILTTTNGGQFRLPPSEMRAATVDGYVLTRRMHRTGGTTLYLFGPTGEATLMAVDESGKPLKDVTFGVSYLDRGHKTYFSSDGVLVLKEFPICLDRGISAAPKGRFQSEVLGLHVKRPAGTLNYQVVFRDRQ